MIVRSLGVAVIEQSDDDNQATGDLITKMTVALWWLYIPFPIITIHYKAENKFPGMGISGKIQQFCISLLEDPSNSYRKLYNTSTWQVFSVSF